MWNYLWTNTKLLHTYSNTAMTKIYWVAVHNAHPIAHTQHSTIIHRPHSKISIVMVLHASPWRPLVFCWFLVGFSSGSVVKFELVWFQQNIHGFVSANFVTQECVYFPLDDWIYLRPAQKNLESHKQSKYKYVQVWRLMSTEYSWRSGASNYAMAFQCLFFLLFADCLSFSCPVWCQLAVESQFHKYLCFSQLRSALQQQDSTQASLTTRQLTVTQVYQD